MFINACVQNDQLVVHFLYAKNTEKKVKNLILDIYGYASLCASVFDTLHLSGNKMTMF